MLQNIRDRAQGWIATLLVTILSAFFALWGVGYYLNSSNANGSAVAKVNGMVITQHALDGAYNRLKELLNQRENGHIQLTPQIQKGLRAQALNSLIHTYAMADGVKKLGFSVSQPQLEMTLAAIPAFQNKGRFSPARFQQFLDRSNYSEKVFFQSLTRTLLIDQLQAAIGNTAFTLPAEINQTISLIKQERDFRYLLIPAKSFAAQTNVTSTEIEKFYKQHAQQFKTPEKMSIEYLELSSDHIKSSLKPTDF